MATFIEDPTNPLTVISSDGRVVPRDMLGPGDVVQTAAPPAAPTSPAPAPAAPAPATPTRTPAVDAVLQKRDQVMAPLETVQSTFNRSVQKGLAPGQLAPILASNTASAEKQAQGIEAAGAARTQRQEQSAMAETGQAFGRQTMAIQDRDQAQQRAEIARQNELALSLQKDPELDPDRFVRNLGTGGGIAAVILSALSGGFNAASGRGGNDALDVLQKRIDADLMAQKEQIASGRIRRGNLIAYFQQQGLRDDAAAKAAEATIWAMADRMAAAEQSRIAAPEHKESAQLLADQLRAQTAAKNQELQLTLGTDRTTESSSTVKARPQAAGAGVESALKQLQLRSAMLDQMDAASISQAIGREVSPEQAKVMKQDAQEYAKATGVNKDLEQRIAKVANLVGLVQDPSGQWVPGASGVDRPLIGEKARQIDAAYAALKEAKVMRMPREPSARLQDEFGDTIEPPFYDDEIAAQLNQLSSVARSADENLRRGFGDAVKLYDSRATAIPYPEAGK
jgi:hypothetical protein